MNEGFLSRFAAYQLSRTVFGMSDLIIAPDDTEIVALFPGHFSKEKWNQQGKMERKREKYKICQHNDWVAHAEDQHATLIESQCLQN